MRRVRFRDEAGVARDGELVGQQIQAGGRSYDFDVVDVLPPTDATKLLGIGANNPSFIKKSDEYGWPDEFSDHPMYVKPSNCFVGHRSTVVLPPDGDFNFQLEFAVVIDEQCRNVPVAEAMDVVEGYTCYNDITDFSGGDWVEMKAFDNAAPIGPVVATPDEVPEDAEMTLRVDGKVEQRGQRLDYIHSVPEVVSHFSVNRTLEAGDVVSIGSASGDLDNLHDGDSVELEIDGIGTLQHGVTFDSSITL